MVKGGGTRCVVAGCRNNRASTQGISYHRFPKDLKLKNKWIQKCCRRQEYNYDRRHTTICSIHFEEEDFERDLKAELLNLKPRRILKKGSIPSQNLPINHLLKQQKERISSILLRSSSDAQNSIHFTEEDFERDLKEENCKEKNPTILRLSSTFLSQDSDSIQSLEIQLEEKNRTIVELKEEIASLKSFLDEKNNTIERLKRNTTVLEKMLVAVFSSKKRKLECTGHLSKLEP